MWWPKHAAHAAFDERQGHLPTQTHRPTTPSMRRVARGHRVHHQPTVMTHMPRYNT